MKKKKKMSDSETKLLLLLLAILMLAAAYFFGYNKLITNAKVIEQQNITDRSTVTTLEGMEARRADVEAETESLRQEIQDIIAKYPSQLPQEKIIWQIRDMEDASGGQGISHSYVLDTLLMDFNTAGTESAGSTDSTEAAASGNTASSEEQPVGYFSTVGINFIVSYDGMKQIAAYVRDLKDRTTMPYITAAYDPETDMLTGTLTLNLYYLTGTGKEYEPPVLGSYPKGVESIFGGGNGTMPAQDQENAGEEAGDTENADEAATTE